MYTEILCLQKLLYCLLVAGQKGLEVLQLSLAAVPVCLSALGTGTEGHWAVGRAPCGEDPPWDAWCRRRGSLCGSQASITLLVTHKGQVATTALATPVSRGKSATPEPLGWGHSPSSCGSRCGPHCWQAAPPLPSSLRQE